MAPATERAAVIVSHGQPSDPYPAEQALKAVASQVASCLSGWTITSATMAAGGTLEQALEHYPAAAIYPLFMADGWFTGTALPDRLLKGQRRILPPFGLDRNLPLLAAEILARRLNGLGWDARETRLVIAAHGGQHSPNPARAARQFAAILARLTQFAEIRVGFVAQAPELSEIARTLGPHALCLPFFATNGRHVRRDIPAALDAAGFKGVTLEPLGIDPKIPDLIAHSLRQNQHQKDAA
jgi:sirohydrochlorin ferrochelatase